MRESVRGGAVHRHHRPAPLASCCSKRVHGVRHSLERGQEQRAALGLGPLPGAAEHSCDAITRLRAEDGGRDLPEQVAAIVAVTPPLAPPLLSLRAPLAVRSHFRTPLVAAIVPTPRAA